MQSIPLSKPSITELERKYVDRVMQSGRLALGPFIEEFEDRFAKMAGTRHAVAVNSGTSALHLIVRALGIGEDDEIITTPYSFVASANAALFEGARPVFVDIDDNSLNIDPNRIQGAITNRTRAILAVDVFGAPADWDSLTSIANENGLHLIDDACEAIGARMHGTPIGAVGDAAAFGFYPNKQLTTGEGGCVTTNSDSINESCRSMRNQGRTDDRYMEHGRLGYNYRMTELSAAIGCAQLIRLPELLKKRATVASWYNNCLSDADCILPAWSADRSWFVYVIRLADDRPADARDTLMAKLREKGIQTAPYFPCIHTQPYYRERFGYSRGDYPVAENASDRTLALPFFPDLDQDAVAFVSETICDLIPRTTRVS